MSFVRETRNSLILTNQSGLIQYRYDQQSDKYIDFPMKQSSITSITSSSNGEYIGISFENKQIYVCNENAEIVKMFTTNRCPSKITFTQTNDLIIADKTGDVYLYKFNENGDIKEPILLLGHPSIILDVILSDCGKYVITGDRDEKIRVSQYPNCYNIVSYCLGHCEFITNLKLCQNILISSSGDGTIRFWNYQHGKQLHLIDTNRYLNGDLEILRDFQNEMNQEKIAINTLPIIDMQICLKQFCFIAVSLYKYNTIQLYQVDLVNFNTNLWRNIDSTNSPFSFYLNATNLFVLNNTKLLKLNLFDDETSTSDSICQLLYEKYKNHLKLIETNNSITVYYKRRFDNVQEYFEKKKVRLENS